MNLGSGALPEPSSPFLHQIFDKGFDFCLKFGSFSDSTLLTNEAAFS